MNDKLKAIDVLLLSLTVLLTVLNTPLRNYLHLSQATLIITGNILYISSLLLSGVYIITSIQKNRKVPKTYVYRALSIIKANYVFFVISYLLLFVFFTKIYDRNIEILYKVFSKLIKGNFIDKLKIVLYLLILAPVTEELFFRKFLFRILRKININLIVIISSLLFMVAHDIADISKIIVGIGLSRMYIRYNSIELCMLTHSANNFCSLVIGVLFVWFFPDINKNSFLFIIPLIFLVPNYVYWYNKIYLDKDITYVDTSQT